MRRIAVFVLGLMLVVSPAAFAEVCAIFNNSGEFVRLDLNYDLENGIVWGPITDRGASGLCLNLAGDGGGVGSFDDLGDDPADEPPVYTVVWMPEESPAKLTYTPINFKDPRAGQANRKFKRKTPVVVWARYDGSDREMVYSFWDYSRGGWAPVTFVERIDNVIDDVNPRIKSRDGGRTAELSWTRNGAVQQVLEATGTPVVVGTSYDIYWSEAEETTSRPGRRSGKSAFRSRPTHKE